MRDGYLIDVAASAVAAGLAALTGPGERQALAAAERKRRKKSKAASKASRKRNRK